MRKGLILVSLCILVKFVGMMALELKDGANEMIFDLGQDEAMENENVWIEPPRIEEVFRLE